MTNPLERATHHRTLPLTEVQAEELDRRLEAHLAASDDVFPWDDGSSPKHMAADQNPMNGRKKPTDSDGQETESQVLARLRRQGEIRLYRGKLPWDGDLEEMRSER